MNIRIGAYLTPSQRYGWNCVLCGHRLKGSAAAVVVDDRDLFAHPSCVENAEFDAQALAEFIDRPAPEADALCVSILGRLADMSAGLEALAARVAMAESDGVSGPSRAHA